MTKWVIHQGDALEQLHALDSESVHCVITSPPYWGLRDYGTAKWEGGSAKCDHLEPQGGMGAASAKQNTSVGSQIAQYKGICRKCNALRVDNQLGLEPAPEEYVTNLVLVFREVKRVLREDGTLWLNLGDSYSGSGKGRNPDGFAHHAGFDIGRKQSTSKGTLIGNVQGGIIPSGCKPKDLVGIPWMVAFALRSDGWYLRSDCIWAKPNPMPESVTDRPTKSHEYVFLLSKTRQYYFDAEAVKEPAVSTDGSIRDRDTTKLNNTPGRTRMGGLISNGYCTRNIRSVWTIATQPFAEAHFATFPPELVKRCLLAGTSERGVCGSCGAPWQRVLETSPMVIDRSMRTHDLGQTRSSGTMIEPPVSKTVGWKPTCSHASDIAPAVVLDPFAGSGTVGVVATRWERDFIGIELNPEYVAMAQRRINGQHEQPALMEALEQSKETQSLLSETS